MRAIHKEFHGYKKPYKDYNVALVTYPDGLVTLRIFENQIMGYGDEQRANVLLSLEALRDKIRGLGVRCELEGVAGDAPTTRRR
jgi:hypothetical protein